jgi:hypothetical protein
MPPRAGTQVRPDRARSVRPYRVPGYPSLASTSYIRVPARDTGLAPTCQLRAIGRVDQVTAHAPGESAHVGTSLVWVVTSVYANMSVDSATPTTFGAMNRA